MKRVNNPNLTFEQVGGLHTGRNRFDLSMQNLMTADMGLLYPVEVRQVIPGDTWHVGCDLVGRMNPAIAPILHQIDAYLYGAFVPHRLVDEDWEETITGGPTGETTLTMPRWIPTDNAVGSLWDYMGFPPGVTPTGDYAPLDYPKRAYNLFWNEYVRDQNEMNPVNIETSEDILPMCWEKDYFASALPFQQRGTAPAIPITGTSQAVFPPGLASASGATFSLDVKTARTTDPSFFTAGTSDARANIDDLFNYNTVDLSTAGAVVTINDIRVSAVLQQWMELSARGGYRYTEYLQRTYGLDPRDSRLQRPEYIGRAKMPLIVGDVPQSSATDSEPTPQGYLAGKGNILGSASIGTYRAEEHGTLLIMLCIRPRAVYTQGFPREWMPQTIYDLYNPQFANISEQAILNGELFAVGNDAADTGIWGYQGRYSEYRYARSRVSGLMRTDFNYWHLAREFPSLPALNADFLAQDDARKDFLAVPAEPAFIMSVAPRIMCDRPIPAVPVPGVERI